MNERNLARQPELTGPGPIPIDRIVIGKDVLELVSSAMYVDPLTIYREYVQNAADSIDEAQAAETLAQR